MKITVTCPDTIFGVIVKSFDNYTDALIWVEVCISNDVKVIVEKI
jgi:hypothetical protein